MRRSKEDTAATRRSIVGTASVEFRRSGIAETALSDIMASVGLTHGGFYRHFDSKEQLATEALQLAFDAGLSAMEQWFGSGSSENAVASFVNHYLAPRHRDDCGNSCPLAALGSDLRRAENRTRDVAAAGMERLVMLLQKQFAELPLREAKARATAIVAAMVGGLMLSRIANDPGTSNSILNDTRDLLLQA